MATLASTNAPPTGKSQESRQARSERIFESLPALGTKDYLDFLKGARRDDPPAGVLVRAYRQLHPSDAADATLGRLVDSGDPPGYLILVVAQARRRRSRLGAYTPSDLIANTVGEIVATIAGPKVASPKGPGRSIWKPASRPRGAGSSDAAASGSGHSRTRMRRRTWSMKVPRQRRRLRSPGVLASSPITSSGSKRSSSGR